jgi:hypothetical protein
LAGVTLIATLGVLVGILAAALTTALVGSFASVLVAGLAAFTARFGGTLGIILEVSAAGRAAFAGNLALPRFVHPRKTAVGIASLIRSILFFFSHVVFPQFCWEGV